VKLLEINLENGNRFIQDINLDDEKAESYAEDYYEREGYNVVNLSPYYFTRKVPEKVVKYVEDKIRPYKADDLSTPGMPDLICWKENNGKIAELFFSEVKSQSDSLRMNQLIWFSKFSKLSGRILCLYDSDEVKFSAGKHGNPIKEVERAVNNL